MADLLDRQLRALVRHRHLQWLIDACAPWAAWSLAIVGAIILVIRLAVPALEFLIIPLLVAGVLVPLVAVPQTLRRQDSPTRLAGQLDLTVGAQGIAMALAAVPVAERDSDWAARLRQPLETMRLPPIQWIAWKGALVAAIWAVLAFAVPQRQVTDPGFVGAALHFMPLLQKLDAAEEAGIIPPEEIAAVKDDIQRLQTHATDHGMDQPTWEGLDRLSQRFNRATEKSARQLSKAMAAAETLAQPSTPAERDRLHNNLAQAVAELAVVAPGLVPRLPPGAGREDFEKVLKQAVQAGALSPEQANAVKQLGLLKPGQHNGNKLDPAREQALRERLAKELAAACEACKKMGLGMDGMNGDRPGKGGVNRGPGHAKLTWEDPKRTDGGGIEGLPAGMQLNPDGSVTIAEQVRDAELDPDLQKAAARAAARAFDPTAADAKRAVVAPQHRAAVERYFAAEGSPKK